MKLFVSFQYLAKIEGKIYSGFANTIVEYDNDVSDTYEINLLTHKIEQNSKQEMGAESIKAVILFFKEIQ